MNTMDNLPAVKNTASVILSPHQFKSEIYLCEIPAGMTISKLFNHNAFPGVKVFKNGDEVSKDNWDFTYIYSCDHVLVSIVPMGGGGDKDIMRMVAMVAVAVVATVATYGAFGWQGLGGYFSMSAGMKAATAAALTIAGQYGVRKLIPPQVPTKPDMDAPTGERKKSITGARNQPNRYGVIPKIYGFNRLYPPLAANYYTSVENNHQYLHMLVMLGYKDDLVVLGPDYDRYDEDWYRSYVGSDGRLVNSNYEMRIGDTDIRNYSDYKYEIGTVDQINLYQSIVQEIHPGTTLSVEDYDNDKGYDEGDVVARYDVIDKYDKNKKYVPPNLVYYKTVTHQDIMEMTSHFHVFECTSTDPKGEDNLPTKENDNSYWDYVTTHSAGGDLAGISYASGGKAESVPTYYVCKKSVPANKDDKGYAHYDPHVDGVDNDYWEKTTTRPTTTRTISETGLNAISFDLTFPRGLFGMDGNGNLGECTAGFTVKIKDTNDPDEPSYWTVVTSDLKITNSSRDTIRRTFTLSDIHEEYFNFDVNADHGWDIRIIRDSTEVKKTNIIGEQAKLSAIRAFKKGEPVNDPDRKFLLIALKLRATDQLNGTIDDLNLHVRSRLPVYNESDGTWTRQETNNPVWAFCDALKGVQLDNPITDERLQLEGTNNILEAANWCENRGNTINAWTTDVTYKVLDTVEYNNEYYTCLQEHKSESGLEPTNNPDRWQRGISIGFDYVFDEDDAISERLQQISTTARAQWIIQDGKFALIRDRVNELPVQRITPRNSWNFSAEKTIMELPKKLKVKYTNPNTLEQDNVVIDLSQLDHIGASYGNNTEEISTVGVTNGPQATLEGWYHLASIEYRPESFTVEMDFENLNCRRGDTVILAHDVMLVGIDANSKISQIVDSVTVELDQNIIFPHPGYEGETHVLRINSPDKDENDVPFINSSIHEIEAVSEGNRIHLKSAMDLSLVSEDDSIIYGIKDMESIEAKIQSIDYNADLSATITLTEDNAQKIIDAVDNQELPDYDPNITEPIDPDIIFPAAPVIDSISGFQYNETKFVSVSLEFTSSKVSTDIAELYWRVSGQSTWNSVRDNVENSSVRIESGLPALGTEIEVKARVRSDSSGKWSNWSPVETYTIDYNSIKNPERPLAFDAEIVDNGIQLTWDEPADANDKRYKIKRGSSSESFDEATPIGSVKSTSFLDNYLSAGDYTYWIHINVDEGNSSTPNFTSISISDPNKPNVSYKVTKNQVNLDWDSCKTDFPIDYYAIWHEAPAFELDTEYNVNDVVEYDGTHYRATNHISSSSETPDNSSDWTTPPWVKTDTQFTRDIFFTGTLEFYVKAVDVAGNESSYDIVSVSVSEVPAATDIITVPATYAIVVRVSASMSNTDEIDAVELHAATTNDRSNATKIYEWNPNNELNFRHTGSDFDPGDTWYYWVRIRDTHGNYGDWYPSSSIDGVSGYVSGDPSDYINLLDSAISNSAIATALNFNSIEDFYKSDYTGRWTVGQNNVTYSGLGTTVVNGVTGIERRMISLDTEDAPVYGTSEALKEDDSGNLYYPRFQVVKNKSGDNKNVDASNVDYYYALVDVPEGTSLSEDATVDGKQAWKKMDSGALSTYSIQVDANGTVAGFGLSTTSEGNSTFLIRADRFGIYDSDADISNDPQSGDSPIFSVGLVNDNNIVGINGDLMIDGTVHLRTLSFTPLESVGNSDEVVGTINASDEGIRISGDKIELHGDTTVYGSFTVTASDNISDVESGADATADHASDIIYEGSNKPSHKKGRLWFDTDTSEFYRSDGSNWNKVSDITSIWETFSTESDIDVLDTTNAPAESGADETAGKSLTVLIDRTLDNISDSGDFKRLQVGTLSNRPTAGTQGRFYLATDAGANGDPVLYRDVGVSWAEAGTASLADTLDSTADYITETARKWASESGADITDDHPNDVIFWQSGTDPGSPSHKEGRFWVDTDNGDFHRSDGSTWHQIGSLDAKRLDNGPADAGADVTKTTIDGGIITTGYLESGDYDSDVDGMLIDLGNKKIEVNESDGLVVNTEGGMSLKDNCSIKFYTGYSEYFELRPTSSGGFLQFIPRMDDGGISFGYSSADDSLHRLSHFLVYTTSYVNIDSQHDIDLRANGADDYAIDLLDANVEMNRNLIPTGEDAQDIGTFNGPWNAVYAVKLTNPDNDLISASHFRPDSDDTTDLGTSNYYWRDLYHNDNFSGQSSYMLDQDCISVVGQLQSQKDSQGNLKRNHKGQPKLDRRSLPEHATNKRQLYNELKKGNCDLINEEDFEEMWQNGDFDEWRSFRDTDAMIDILTGAVYQLSERIKELEANNKNNNS